jgi:hypothetical protein
MSVLSLSLLPFGGSCLLPVSANAPASRRPCRMLALPANGGEAPHRIEAGAAARSTGPTPLAGAAYAGSPGNA